MRRVSLNQRSLARLSAHAASVIGAVTLLAGCTLFSTEPKPGPDKQAVGLMAGAATGAGSGAVIASNLGGATGTGAWIGAGFGALFGTLSGLGIDLLEEDQLRRFDETEHAKEQLWAQEMLAEHYARRLELHPNRDIFPADWFFEADSSNLKPEAVILSRELGLLTRQRMPWSRIVVAVYVTSDDPESAYAQYVTKQRAQEIATQFVKAGMEPRRVLTQGVTVSEPVLVDPNDSPGRYRQAVEIIPLDR